MQMNRTAPVFRRRRSSATLWEQLQEYFEVRFRAEKYGVPYFLAESEAKQSDPRKEAAGARARNAVEDLNGGDPPKMGGQPFKPQTALLR
jgi:beta-galactosidase/beta-glucuronidase